MTNNPGCVIWVAIVPDRGEISVMTRTSMINRIALHGSAALVLLLAANIAAAQSLMPGTSPLAPLLPPPLPIPKITVPVVPKFDAPAKPSYQPSAPQPSFGERIQSCLDAGAAA